MHKRVPSGPMVSVPLVLWWLGCGLPRCDELCAVKADCVEEELRAYDATWPEFTGFDDREAYEEACYEVFTDGREEGADRGAQQQVCRAELEQGCDR